MNKYQEYIYEHVNQRELYELLAEEASELAQASLKFSGLLNNTLIIWDDALEVLEKVDEEIDDVTLVYHIINGVDVDEECFPKLKRLALRLGYGNS